MVFQINLHEFWYKYKKISWLNTIEPNDSLIDKCTALVWDIGIQYDMATKWPKFWLDFSKFKKKTNCNETFQQEQLKYRRKNHVFPKSKNNNLIFYLYFENEDCNENNSCDLK